MRTRVRFERVFSEPAHKVMREAGIAGVSGRKGARTTRREAEAWPAPDPPSATSRQSAYEEQMRAEP
jgi:hypothetical protein